MTSVSSNIKILKDARFDDTLSNRYELVLSIAACKYVAIIFDSFENRFVCLYEFSTGEYLSLQETKHLLESFISEQFGKIAFKKITTLFVTPKITLVPDAVFDASHVQSFFEFDHFRDGDETIEYSFVRNGAMYMIYSIPQWIKEIVLRKFPNTVFAPHSHSLIDSILLLNKNKISLSKLYINIEKDFFDVIVIGNGNLQLYNSFAYSNSKDFMYFLMNVYEQLKLNPEVHPITCMGLISIDSEIITQARQFIKNINFISYRDEMQRFSYVFDEVSPIHYVSLLNSISCV